MAMLNETNPSPEASLLQPGTLWSQVMKVTQQALECGALQPIPTTYEVIAQRNIRFIVRVTANLIRKDECQQQRLESKTITDTNFNPFLPYEQDLFVANLSETHLVILNKFPVVDHHLLIITRRFEDQQNWLTLTDFAALSACMTEFESLGFYNAGQVAGASQRHKHLQIIPLPLIPGEIDVPVTPLITALPWQHNAETIPDFPFLHAIKLLDLDWSQPAFATTQTLLDAYHELLCAVGFKKDGPQSAPYNLLVTRRWMLIVPRSQESFADISINSLGFAGSLFVRNDTQMQQLKQIGPLTVLKGVAISEPEKLR